MGNFRGFEAIFESFLCKIWGCGVLWQHQWTIHESFLHENPPICESFLPQKFPTILYGSVNLKWINFCEFMQNSQSECLRCFLLPPLATTPFWLYPSLRAEGQEEKSHGRLLASTAMQWCKLDQVWTLVSEWNWFYSQSPVHLWSILVFGMWIRLQDALMQYGWNISLPSLVPESIHIFISPSILPVSTWRYRGVLIIIMFPDLPHFQFSSV